MTTGSSELAFAHYLLGVMTFDDHQLYLLDVSRLAAMVQAEQVAAE